MASKTVGAQSDGSTVDAIEQDEATADRINAVVLDEVVGRCYATRKPDGYRILDENVGVGVRKDNTELRIQLDGALDAVKGQRYPCGNLRQVARQEHF